MALFALLRVTSKQQPTTTIKYVHTFCSGGEHEWGVEETEDTQTWVPMAEVQSGRPDTAWNRPATRWEKSAERGTRRGVVVEPTASKSWERVGSASSRDNIETTARAGGAGAGITAGKKWPTYRGVVGASAGTRRSREKQC